MQRKQGRNGGQGGRSKLGAAVLLATVGLGGCDSLLEVELPGNMTEGDLLQPSSATMIVNSAIADFECGYSWFTVLVASMEDVWWRTTGYWGGWAEYRTTRPTAGNCSQADIGTNWSTAIQKARYMSEMAHREITGWGSAVPNQARLLAIAATYAGLSYEVFGETYCELTVDVGPLMTNTEVLQKSEEWFTTALGHMGSGDFSLVSTQSLKQLALLGRARVRLALGNLPGAQADASQIQPGFVAYATRDADPATRWNRTYRSLNVNLFASIADVVTWQGQPVPFTGYRNLTIASDGRPTRANGVADPRVPVVYTGQFAADGVTDNYMQQKFMSHDADIPVARWAEAQLILAEIEGGTAAVTRINALRNVHGLPHYQGGTTTQEVRDLIIEERRREFFLEGRFMADKLRYNLWFPRGVGANHKAVTYGNATCFMMPLIEYQNNPNIPAGYEGPYSG